MNPDLRKLAETYLLSESVSHKEWRALVVKMLADEHHHSVDAEFVAFDMMMDAEKRCARVDGLDIARRCAAEINKERQREVDCGRRWDNVEMTGGLLAIGFFILLYLYMRAA